jgi:hypothetical protein
MADMTAWQNEQRALMQRLLAGDYSPYEIDATLTGGENPYGIVPKGGYQLNSVGATMDPKWRYANDYKIHQTPEGDAQYGWVDPEYTPEEIAAWEAGRPMHSLFTNKQLQQMQQSGNSVMGWDASGRPIVQGEKIWGQGGYWTPKGRQTDTSDPEILGGTQGAFEWTWNPAERNGVPASQVDPNGQNTLLNAGVQAHESFAGGVIGQGGWSGLSAVAMIAGPILGNAGAFASVKDAIDAASVAVSDATGLSPAAANSAVNAVANAGTGAIKSTISGGDPLTGAISGGLSSVAGDTINGLTGGDSPTLPTGNGLDMTDMTMDGVPETPITLGSTDGLTGNFTNTPTGLGALPETPAGGNMFDMTDMNMDGVTSFDMTDMNMDGVPGGDTGGGFDWTKLLQPGIKGLLGLGSTIMGSNAVNNATDAQTKAANNALALNAAQYAQNRQDFMPYMQQGYKGLGDLKNFDMQAGLGQLPSYQTEVTDKLPLYNEDPAIKAQKSLAQRGLQRQLNARGLNYGATGASAAADLNMNYDAQGYDKYSGELKNRYAALGNEYQTRYGQNNDAYNKIMNDIKIGQGAAGSVQNASNNYVNNATAANTAAGNAAGQGDIAQANIYKNLFQGLGNLITDNSTSNKYGNNTGNTQNPGWFNSMFGGQ